MSDLWRFDRPVRPHNTRFNVGITREDLKKEPDNGSRLRHKVAMFLTGFIMLTPHRIAILCAPYILKRFHLPPATVPLFIYKIHNPMELASLIGTIIQLVTTSIIAAITSAVFQNKNGSDAQNGTNPVLFGKKVYKGANADWSDKHKDVAATQWKGLFSIGFAWIMFSSSILTYIFFVTGDDYGNFNLFFWSVIFNAFTNGLYSSISFGINTNAAIYAVGLPLSGAFTFIFNKICRFIHERWDWDDYDYTRVQLQIIFTILILFITAAIWTADQVIQIIGYTKSGDTAQPQDDNDNHAPANVPGSTDIKELFDPKHEQGIRHWSPILMLGSSLGSVYAFYPAITPYMLMDIDEANDLDQWIQFISSIPTLVIGFLDEFDKGPGGISSGIWGDLVNDAGDTDGAKEAKDILTRGETTLKVTSAWNGDTDKWTDTHKTNIITNLEQATSENNTSKATTANSLIETAKIDLKPPGETAADEAKAVLDDAKNKLDGIGEHTTPNTAAPNTANNWNKGGGGRFWWHPIGWGPFIPYILCLHIFITMLHFPTGYVATFLHSKQWLLKCICISFNFWQEIMEIIGFAGAGKQSNKSGYAMVYNSSVGTFNNFFFFFVMINCMFTGDIQQALWKLLIFQNYNIG